MYKLMLITQITEITGQLSGTLTYVLSQVEKSVAFSNAVSKAKELGYTEPDPRWNANSILYLFIIIETIFLAWMWLGRF